MISTFRTYRYKMPFLLLIEKDNSTYSIVEWCDLLFFLFLVDAYYNRQVLP